ELSYNLHLEFMDRFFSTGNDQYTQDGIPVLSTHVTGLGRQAQYTRGNSFRARTLDEFANGFHGFSDVQKYLEEKSPPLSLETEIEYELTVDRCKTPFDIGRSIKKIFSTAAKTKDTIPFWQLPSRLFQIQDDLVAAPVNMPKFRICFDYKNDRESAFRLVHEANCFDDLVEGITKKVPETLRAHHQEVWDKQDEPFTEWPFDKRPPRIKFYRSVEGLPHFSMAIHSYSLSQPFIIATRPMQDYGFALHTLREKAMRVKKSLFAGQERSIGFDPE
ncbi:MAG TPA: hypothetical protein VIG74_04900, partial [Alphaproteobacteria bacterium]